MSLLRDRINRDTREKERVEQKIQNVTVRPTESERTIADQLIRDVSEQFKEEISKCGLTEEIQEKIRLYVRSTITKLDYDDYSVKIRIEKVVLSSIIGLGPIDPFLHDPSVTEIIVQRYNCISVERNGLVEETDAEFVSEEHLMTVINRIIQPVGRQINLHSPLVDARLKDGSRVNVVLRPVALNGPILTIRKFPEEAITMEKLIEWESLSQEAADYLKILVQAGYNIFISGATSTGKTTFLNVLADYIPKTERVITIEDSAELQLHDIANLVRMEVRQADAEGVSSVTLRDLIKASLRMRPDRIIVGEVRGPEALDMIQSIICTI